MDYIFLSRQVCQLQCLSEKRLIQIKGNLHWITFDEVGMNCMLF